MSNKQVEFGIRISVKDGQAAAAEIENIGTAAVKSSSQVEKAGKTMSSGLEAGAVAAVPFTAKVQAADKAMQGMTVSAKQTALAMRMVPAQMTDIVTQLAGGQSPFLVLLQQGGQMKDMFGGIGPMFRGLAAAINPVTVGVLGAGAAVGVLAYQAYQGHEEVARLNTAVRLTGEYTGRTTQQLRDAAAHVAISSAGITAAHAAITALVATGRVGGEQLESFGRVAVLMAENTGEGIEKVSGSLAELSDDAVKWAEKYNRQYHFMSAAQYELARQYQDTGNKAAATKVVIDALHESQKRIYDDNRKDMGTIARWWDEWGVAIDKVKRSLMGIGVPKTTDDKINAALTLREGLEKQLASAEKWGDQERQKYLQSQLDKNRDLINSLRDVRDEEKKHAREREKEAAEGDASMRITSYLESSKHASPAKQKALAIQEENKEFAEAVRGYDTSSKKYEEAVARHQANLKQINEQFGKADAEKARAAEKARLKLTQDEANERSKLRNAEYDGVNKYLAEQENAYIEKNKALRESNKALDAEIKTIGLSKEALAQHEAAVINDTMAKKEAQLADINLDAGGKARADQLRIEIDLLKERRGLMLAKGQAEASAESAKKTAEEWKKASDEINRSLTDAIMRGFEGGKGVVENFRDTVKNAFKTLVLRPGVEMAMSPVTGSLKGLLSGGVAGGTTTAMGGAGLQGIQSAFSGALDSWGAKIGFRDPSFVGPMQPGMSAMTGSQAFGAMGAGAGVGGMVGGAVGRATGSKGMGAAAGAVSGAAMGAMVGGPWGAAIGAVAGGLMGYFGSGSKEKRNAAGASVDYLGNVTNVGRRGDGGDSSNVAGVRRFADQFAQAQRAMDRIGGLTGVLRSSAWNIGSTKTDFGSVGGIRIENTAGDVEGLMLKAVKAANMLATGGDNYVRRAIAGLQAGDLGNLVPILEFAKTFKATKDSYTYARDPRMGQVMDISAEAKSSADALRVQLANFRDEAVRLGMVRTAAEKADLTNSLSNKALAEMGLTTATSKPLEGMALEMQKVKENANAMRTVLAELGYSVETQTNLINKAIQKGQADLRTDFMSSVSDRILELTDASKFAEKQLKKEHDARLADAKALGLTAAQLKEVTKLNELERTAKLRQQADTLSGWLKGQRLSDLSTLSPEAKFSEAQKQFASLMGSARKGDADALSQVTSAADVLLAAGRDQYASGSRYAALETMVRSQVNSLGVSLKLPGFDPVTQAAEQKRQTDELKKQTVELKALIVQSGMSSTAMVSKLAAIEKRLASIESAGRLAGAA